MISIHYFGAIAEAAGRATETLKLKDNNLQEVLRMLCVKYDFGQTPIQVAVNQNIVTSPEKVKLAENDEIALLPPFAGG